jgi:2-oxoglutarate dehydrogenase E2 component (dihydrolipoamide succinyltransferase)
MSTDVKVPTLGESITEATIGQWLKAPGDAVALDEPIASLETDKVSVEVPSPVAGTLAEQLFKEGDTVAVGAVLARIGEGGHAGLRPRYAGRAASASPATGLAKRHVAEQAALIADALGHRSAAPAAAQAAVETVRTAGKAGS